MSDRSRTAVVSNTVGRQVWRPLSRNYQCSIALAIIEPRIILLIGPLAHCQLFHEKIYWPSNAPSTTAVHSKSGARPCTRAVTSAMLEYLPYSSWLRTGKLRRTFAQFRGMKGIMTVCGDGGVLESFARSPVDRSTRALGPGLGGLVEEDKARSSWSSRETPALRRGS